jgi:hypothetical protein
VRIEGRAPDGILPPGTSTIPSAKRYAELNTRLFVETLRGDGRALLRDYVATQQESGYGMPGDARHVVPVGKKQ